MSEEKLEILGLEILIERKAIKHMYIRITKQPPHVQISAPWRLSQKKIHQQLLTKQNWIQSKLAQLMASPPLPSFADINQTDRSTLLQMAQTLIDNWAPKLGVNISFLGIKAMKTRWGSCNPKRQRIWLNAQLLHKPLVCLEYVVVHELVHLLEPSHNKRFYELMGQYLPDWHLRKKVLNA